MMHTRREFLESSLKTSTLLALAAQVPAFLCRTALGAGPRDLFVMLTAEGLLVASLGAALGIAIRCASTSYKVELRSQLQAQSGRVSGSWEERNFNAAGSVSGQASESRISLTVVGGGMTGTMNVSSSGGAQQSVVITTQGTGLKSVNITLSKG